MGGDLAALKRLSEERVAPPSEFAVAAHVWEGVRSWETVLRPAHDAVHTVNLVCGECGQAIMVSWNDKGRFEYNQDQVDGLKLAHLIQAHGWTRETIGEH